MSSLASFQDRLRAVMQHAEGIAKLLQGPIAIPGQYDQLRRHRSDLIHSIEQLWRVLAPFPEETLWVADLKYCLHVFKDDVEEAADLATTKYEKVQRCVEALGPGQSAEALEKWGQACQEAHVASTVFSQRIAESLRLARVEADKAYVAFETAGQADADQSGAPEGEKQTRHTRGRPGDTDPKADKRIFEAWESGRHKTYEECAHALGRNKREVKAAVDRHRKRIERAAK